ncbi:MAG TPA: PAS domain S-box protein [Candidatus Saccharimonadia bacterium]|nr:PAS domain S-box protein [Candidatus Saccharimonadia bacterium]
MSEVAQHPDRPASLRRELQQVRTALHESEQRAAGILETAINAIVTMREDGSILTANSATERMFGYTKSELLGSNVSMLMPSPYREEHQQHQKRYRKTGERQVSGVGREALGLRKDGSVFPIDLSVGEVHLPSGRIFTWIIRDISDRKNLEREMLQVSEREQQRIGQDIHDDLCQHLAAIACLAQVVQQRLKTSSPKDAEGLAEVIKLVSQTSSRAREMAHGLVPVDLESGGLMHALGELVRSTEKVFRITCRFHCEREILVADSMVALQVYRIAQEAVANAIKHSKATRLEITLAESDKRVNLTIQDNGVGIPEHLPARGTGMGLLTMAHRAKLVGGLLQVARNKTGGTVVTCQVPKHPVEIKARDEK